MKKIFILSILSLAMFSCKEEPPKDYATVSGKIENIGDNNSLTIFNREGFNRAITLNADGTFRDTLKVEEGRYNFTVGNKTGAIYLKNDNESSLSLDLDDFEASIEFNGDDANKNNFLINYGRIQQKYINDQLFEGSSDDFDNAFNSLRADIQDLKNKNKDIDTSFYGQDDKTIEMMYTAYKKYHDGKIALRKSFPKGSKSPAFVGYENFKGGKTSLSDLKGKYVYVDVWATWCGPCKREIPSLKKIEKQYHGKDIEFVSISVDDARRSGSDEKAHAAWKQMVAEKELGGIQLFSDKAWQSDFVREYKITGIPRFILIDPNGNIVTPDAPRPSSKKLIELFNSLNI